MDTETLIVSMRATFHDIYFGWSTSMLRTWHVRRSKRYMRAFGTADYPVTIETLRNLKLETWGWGFIRQTKYFLVPVPVKTTANGLRISQETRRKCISFGVSRNSGEKTRWSYRISCSLAKKVRWESRRCQAGSNEPYLYLSACLSAVSFSWLIYLLIPLLFWFHYTEKRNCAV